MWHFSKMQLAKDINQESAPASLLPRKENFSWNSDAQTPGNVFLANSKKSFMTLETHLETSGLHLSEHYCSFQWSFIPSKQPGFTARRKKSQDNLAQMQVYDYSSTGIVQSYSQFNSLLTETAHPWDNRHYTLKIKMSSNMYLTIISSVIT